ncbi:IclR family transcriptional regulator [Jannaschia aquimarina]|uniref:IclR protein n=1 Tax=Jannaschia aquimarina TaxID=935700 RepID=A0A0D1EIN9_9RHOB|nr:IclR family transcriptional regulator [Jannaschia aquimarina]KIT15700.1 Acetate operon repressor [Jannaschia aquimarina]SNT38982.1 transcriptional regulator, IclR family [Jannaschia aquimarina]
MDGGRDDPIPTNLRLLLVLEELARAGGPVTPTEVNAELGLPKPTIHRLFATLEQEGFVQRDIDGRSYSPGARLRSFAGNVLSSLRIRTARQAILQRLSNEIGETCNIALPDRDAMVYVDRAETDWPLRIQLPIGTRVPFTCTASGKLYLSSLDERHLDQLLVATRLEARTSNTITDREALAQEIARIRAEGYATDDGEFMDDMVALAVPIYGPEGRLMATLSFHAPAQRFDLERARTYLPQMLAASNALMRLVTDGG